MARTTDQVSNSPEELDDNDAALQDSLGQTLFNAYADLVDTHGASFGRTDTNNNGFLSDIELVSSLGIEPRSRALHEKSSDIEEKSNDEYGDEASGITYRDLHRNLSDAIASAGSSIKDTFTDGLSIDSSTDAETGELTGLKIKDEKRDINIRWSPIAIEISQNNFPEQPNSTYEANLERALGAEAHKAYKDYIDGGLKSFDTIDYDDNGTLDEKELNEFLILSKNSRQPGLQRQHEAAVHMLENMDEIKNAVDDEWIGTEDGITMNDLKVQFIKLAASDDTKERVERGIQEGAPGSLQYLKWGGLTAHDGLSGVTISTSAEGRGPNAVLIDDQLRGARTIIRSSGLTKTEYR